VEDEEVTDEGPFFPGGDFGEVGFDFFGLFCASQGEAAGESGDVGIDDDAFYLVEGISEDDVGGFSTDACEACELLHGLGDLSLVFIDE
jgi:hypothetical protein